MINNVIPIGLKGIVLIGFLAAFMSTFSISINNGCSYVINDLYLRHIRPKATNKEFITVTYVMSVVIVFAGILIGISMQSILELSIWIFSIMFGGMIVPLVLRWYWWRFNGWGFSAGAGAAFLIAILQKILQKNGIIDWPDYYFYYLMISTSFVVSVIVTFLTPVTDESTLIKFYSAVHPWGFWKPVHEKVLQANPNFVSENMMKYDLFNMGVGAASIFALNVLPFYFMLHNWHMVGILGFIFLTTAVILYFTWYKTLPNDEDDKISRVDKYVQPELIPNKMPVQPDIVE